MRDISDKLEGIGDKLDDLSVLVQQQSELLRRLAPNDTKTLPSEIVATRRK
jgi:hypothetical protein